MNISVITNNKDFIRFLTDRSTGIKINSTYRTIAEEDEYNKFINDFNYIDSLVFLDTQDLSKEFKALFSSLRGERMDFLSTDEVVIVTHKAQTTSPTPDLETTLETVSAILTKQNIPLRIIRLETLKFQDIYKSLTSSDNIKDAKPKKFLKYKVTHNSEGVTIPPKKTKQAIVPDKPKGLGAAAKLEDMANAELLEGVTVPSLPIIQPARTSKEFKDELANPVLDSTVVFITGDRRVGKTTLALKCAKELEEQNLISSVLDLTGRRDMRLLNNFVGCDMSFVKGLNRSTFTGKSVLGLEVAKKVYTATFLTSVVKMVTTGSSVVFCEVDLDQVENMYSTFQGNKAILVVVPNQISVIRDSKNTMNSKDVPIVLVVNNLNKFENDIVEDNLLDSFINAKVLFNMEDLETITAAVLG